MVANQNRIRTQASLGTELKRRYKEGQNIDRISLAIVKGINYRYNTVDVSSYSAESEFNTSHYTEGKYSAKLPVQFSGRTQDGEPFGQVNPIEIGTLVLIGFLNGKKATPIVLAIVGNLEDNKELSRSPIGGADPKDEEMKQLTQQTFNVYPGLTYENIDGFGNRVTTFTGKSFIAFDADSNPDLGGLTDSGVGSDYEEFDSSYYYSGRLIEPKETKAPVILFKHTGDKYDERQEDYVEDNHSTLMYIDQDGTYRTSVVDPDKDARSYIEIDRETGRIRLRKQNDSTVPNQGNDYIGLDIDDRGLLFSVKGKHFRVDENGFGGGFGGSGEVPDEVFDRIQEKIDAINRNIIEMGTYMVSSDEFIEMGAYLTEVVNDELVKYNSRFTVMAEQIEQAVSERRIQGLIDNSLENYSDDMAKLVETANESMKQLESLVDDGLLSPKEKTQVMVEWGMIQAEYPGYLYQAEQAGVDPEDYQKAYNDLENYITPILEDPDSTSQIEPHIFIEYFKRYFDERTKLLIDIFDYFQEQMEEAIELATEAGKTANKAIGDSASAINRADDINGKLEELTDDGILTPSEKRTFKREYELLIGNYDQYIDQAEEFEIDTSRLTTAKENLDNIVEPIIKDMTETTSVNREQILEAFMEYNKAQLDFLHEVARVNRLALLQVQEDFESYDTRLNQTSREITALAESVKAQGREISLATAMLTIQSDRIAQRVTRTQMFREDNANRNINAVGENLFVKETSSSGYINQDTGATVPSREHVVSNFIRINPYTLHTATVFNNNTNNELVLAYYDSARNFIESHAVSGTDEILKLQELSPSNAYHARVSYISTPENQIQFEKGSGSTYFMFSPLDLVANVEFATEDYQTRKENVDKYESLKAELDADQASYESQLPEGETFTEEDKNALIALVENMREKDAEVYEEAEAQGINTLALQGAYENLHNLVTNQTVPTNMDSFLPVLKRQLENYFLQRSRTLDIIIENHRVAMEASEQVLDQALESASEAERLARQLATQAENASQNVAHMEYEIEKANQIESEHLEYAKAISELGYVDPEQKPQLNAYLQDILDEQEYLKIQANFYGLGTADLDNAVNALDSYLSDILDIADWHDTIEVDGQTFHEHFQNYHYAKLNLLEGILKGAKGEYEDKSSKADTAQKEALRREREFQEYKHAVADSRLAIIEVQERIESLTNSLPFTIRVTSTNGLTFKNGVINTYLKAEIFEGSENITGRIKQEDFVWTKINADGTEDEEWTNEHKGVGSQIHLTHRDIDSRATFIVEIFEEEEEGEDGE